MGEHGFDGVLAYNRSKLANILFARQLARRWPDVSVYAAHPGAVLTDMMFRMVAEIRLARLIFPLIRWQLLTPDESAQGIVRIAVDPALTEASGTYFEVGHPAQSSRLADDAGVGQQLFDATTAYLNQ